MLKNNLIMVDLHKILNNNLNNKKKMNIYIIMI